MDFGYRSPVPGKRQLDFNFQPTAWILIVSAAAGALAMHFAGPLLDRGKALREVAIGARESEPREHTESHLHPVSGKAPPQSGRPLVDRLRGLLVLQGIDASWAKELAAADAKGFPDLLKRIVDLSGEPRDRLKELLFARWAELDPEGAVAFFESKGDRANLNLFLFQWSREDFPAAVLGSEGKSFFNSVLQIKCTIDPAGLLAWLKTRDDINPLKEFSFVFGDDAECIKKLTALDPDRMKAWASAIPEEDLTAEFFHVLASALAAGSPRDALVYADSLTVPENAAEARAGVLEVLAGTDPAQALQLMADKPFGDDYGGRTLAYGILAKVDLKDPDKVLGMAESLPAGSENRRSLVEKLVGNLLEHDPVKAFSIVGRMGPDLGSADYSIVPPAGCTPEGALRLLEAAGQFGESPFRDKVLKQSLLGWMEKNPASLGEYLSGKMETPILSGLRGQLEAGLAMQKLATGKVDPALEAVLGLKPETMVRAWQNTDAYRAADVFIGVSDVGARSNLLGGLARELVREDRGYAMSWAEKLQNPDEQAVVWKNIAEDWVTEDSLKASEWIATLPQGPARDPAVLAMTRGIQDSDPDLAWQWALSMSGGALRSEALAGAAKAWRRKDPGALEAALAGGQLTVDEKSALTIQPGGGR